MCKRIMITLTSSESKRLIAKSIALLPSVQKAFKEGIVSIQLSTSNAYIYEELTGKKIDKANHACGYLCAAGGCTAYLPAINKREFYFEKGEEKYINFPTADFRKLFDKMTGEDIIIKSGNILDKNMRAGVFVGEPNGTGGEWGVALAYVMCKGINLIVPMTLNKSAHVDIYDVMKETGIDKVDHQRTHVYAGMLPLPGTVVTEIDALKNLTGVDAIPVAMNGVGSGEGTVTLLLKGEEESISTAWELVTSIKGEPQLNIKSQCYDCLAVKNNGICRAKQRIYK